MSHTDFNLYTHFQRRLLARGDQELLRTAADVSCSGIDIDRRAAQFAGSLLTLGARPGDRVSVQAGKSVDSLCLYLGCLRAGLVYHPLNPAYTDHELEFFFTNAEPAIVVCDPGDEKRIRDMGMPAGVRDIVTLGTDGGGSLAGAAEKSSAMEDVAATGKDDLAALLYSSGTTGVPKGIMLSHANLLSNTQTLVDAWGFTESDRLLHALPIFHVHGLFVANGCVLLGGASMRWLHSFDAASVIKYLPESTVFMGVPTFYTRLLAEPDFNKALTRNMRLFVSGSAPLLEETFAAFESRTGHRILERYGMTETNMNTSNPLQGLRKPGTVGPPLDGVEIRICDDAGKIMARGEVGNLQVRGPNVFLGYWRMPEKSAEDFTADGFFNTGDKGIIDEDGYVSIVGRAKDVVITGGLNVFPKEVELVIDDLPGVRETAVIGVPHADFGEGIVAVVVRELKVSMSEADVVHACKEKLANFKVPKYVVFVEDLPRNTMGKVQKNVLRETYESSFAGDSSN